MGMFFKKKEPVATDEAPSANMAFPDIGGEDPGLTPDANTEHTHPSAGGPSAVDLAAQFDTFREEAAAREDRLINALTNMGQAGAPAAPVTPAAPAEFEAASMPSFDEDPEGYARVLQENTVGAVQHMMRAQETERTTNAASSNVYGDLWNDFSAKYEDLAEYDDLVEVHAGKIMRDLRARKVNVEDYISRNRDQFMETIASAVGARLVAMGVSPLTASGGGERPDPNKAPANRTQGLPGNTGIGDPANAGVKPDDGRPVTTGLVAEMHAQQRNMGLI